MPCRASSGTLGPPSRASPMIMSSFAMRTRLATSYVDYRDLRQQACPSCYSSGLLLPQQRCRQAVSIQLAGICMPRLHGLFLFCDCELSHSSWMCATKCTSVFLFVLASSCLFKKCAAPFVNVRTLFGATGVIAQILPKSWRM